MKAHSTHTSISPKHGNSFATEPSTLRGLCVSCGSGDGRSEDVAAVEALTDMLVRDQVTLIYGGTRVGLMRRLADSMLQKGGRAEGVMPRALVDIERAHPGLHALHVVDDMATRKALMAQLSDACIALSGGIRTTDELFEAWTAAYVGSNRNAVGLLNVGGFWDPLLGMLEAQVATRYLSQAHRNTLLISNDPDILMRKLRGYRYSDEGKIATEQSLPPAPDGS